MYQLNVLRDKATGVSRSVERGQDRGFSKVVRTNTVYGSYEQTWIQIKKDDLAEFYVLPFFYGVTFATFYP